MKIKKLEYENFRNFKEHGIIECSTDGRITIIYGKNGDGKTTLHQLFQWVFYGQVKFNKTTNDRLYNLSFEREQSYNAIFEVLGRIDFEHNKEQYSLTRKSIYRKSIDNSEKIGEEMSLQKMDSDYNWKKVDKPEETIEKLLPSGLSEYFFFDGESMIADLRVKGKDSAAKLKNALYTMFDLDILENAIDHIGRTELKTTALGKLYLSKGSNTSGSEISNLKEEIEKLQDNINNLKEDINKAKKEKDEKSNIIKDISEEIGSAHSKAEYEQERSRLKNQRDQFLNNAKRETEKFANTVAEMFPSLLVSSAVIAAQETLNLKVKDSKLPDGVNKKLIDYLLKETTDICICGNKLCDKEKEHIKDYLNLLPPKSYSSMYHDFTKSAEQTRTIYDKEKLEDIIKSVLDNNGQATQCDKRISQLDEEEKQSRDIEKLIINRKKAEERINDLDSMMIKWEADRKIRVKAHEKKREKFDELTSKNKENEIVELKIEVLSKVLAHFKEEIERESNNYSKKLQENIQFLLDNMLTSKRAVSVSQDFAVRVTDTFNDESKSEGQFAVVSFAYIGGILEMLKNNDGLSTKEYPLVLDGPFSKLDLDQRQNVVDMLPKFATQVIVFSKDDLHDVIASENIGRVWTIQSNYEKNIATVKEGKLWK